MEIEEAGEQTTVVVELAPFLGRFATLEENQGQALTKYLLRYLHELVADLAFSTEVSLVIRSNEAENSFEMTSYQVLINDRKCRLPLPTRIPQEVTAIELARSIARVICRNRELWITSSLAQKLWQQWVSQNESSQGHIPALSQADFYEFLSNLVRYGFKLERGKQAIQRSKDKEPADWQVTRLFEDTIASWDAVGITVFLSNTQYAMLTGNGEAPEGASVASDKQIEEIFNEIQNIYYRDLGVILPKVSFHLDEQLEEDAFRIQLNDLRFPSIAGLKQDQFLVYSGTIDTLADIGITGERTLNPLTQRECAIVQSEEDAAKVRDEAHLATWSPEHLVLRSINHEIIKTVGGFLNTDAVKFNTNLLQQIFPVLVDTVSDRFDTVTLTQIFRDLLEEEFSIRDLVPLLEALLAIRGTTKIDLSANVVFFPPATNLSPVTEGKNGEAVVDYTNYLRMVFKRYISNKYTGADNTLFVYLVHPKMQTRIKSIDKQPLNDEEYKQLMKAILNLTEQLDPTSIDPEPVILAPYDIRKKLRNTIKKEFSWLAVLSFEELLPSVDLRILGWIS